MFDFLTPLTADDFHQQTEFLIDGFIAKNLITMFYADGGCGKSWLAMGITKYADQHGMQTVYLDYDNPMSVLKERGVEHKLIQTCPALHYSHRSKTPLSPIDMLSAIENQAVGGRYTNTLFVLDSLRDFGDINNDAAAMRIMEKLKNIREAGATIVLLHHSNKDGRNYQGSNNIRNSIDNMYHLSQTDAPDGQIRWILSVKKERAAIVDIALSLKVDDLSLMPLNLNEARMTPEEKSFVDAVKTVLTQQPGINKKHLLDELGYDKRDKTANQRLDQFEDLYWVSQKIKGVYTYQLIQ